MSGYELALTTFACVLSLLALGYLGFGLFQFARGRGWLFEPAGRFGTWPLFLSFAMNMVAIWQRHSEPLVERVGFKPAVEVYLVIALASVVWYMLSKAAAWRRDGRDALLGPARRSERIAAMMLFAAGIWTV
jgi:hypothetical protein